MREKWQKQMPLMPEIADHPQAQELQAIASIIGSKPTICTYALQDLSGDVADENNAGAKGMSADQVLRAAIVKSLFGFSYEALAFHMVDSQSIRSFCQIGIADKGLRNRCCKRTSKPCPAKPGKRSTARYLDTLSSTKSRKGAGPESIAPSLKATFMSPSDSSLLNDCVRAFCRLMEKINFRSRAFCVPFSFSRPPARSQTPDA
jgi:IS5 family transposase